MQALVDKLYKQHILTADEFHLLLAHYQDAKLCEFLFSCARAVSNMHFGNKIYIRGLIEISNYCQNNCYYCGIRAGNRHVQRYRLSKEEILSCCRQGYALGFRTFVLQGGEDPYYTDDTLCEIVSAIKAMYSDCAVTLSLGERTRESYQRLYESGADRYLLRHETADPLHYSRLHPKNLSLTKRISCLFDLKEIGYQTGTGFMVGYPYQTNATLIQDLLFIQKLSPQMVGIGPFIPHTQTPFANKPQGSVQLCLFLIALLRLMLPNALLPATTALGTAEKSGRCKGILAGANVVMPNLSPIYRRAQYELYDNKISADEEAAEGLALLKKQLAGIGYTVVVDRGDFEPT